MKPESATVVVPQDLVPVHVAFRESLGIVDQELISQFGLDAYVAVATVAQGKRAAGRLTVEPGEEANFVALAHALGVQCKVGRARLVSLPDVVEGSGHSGLFVFEDRDDASVIVYFALTGTLASGAEAAELHAHHELLGSLFGYPPCCVDFFIRHDPRGADYTSASVSAVGPFSKAMNPVSPYVYGAVNTIFHFPCRLDCSASLALRNDRNNWLAAMCPQMSVYDRLGAGLAIYGPDLGIGLVTQYELLNEDTYLVHRVDSQSSTTHALFPADRPTVVKLQGPHLVSLNGKLFAHTSQFAARFE